MRRSLRLRRALRRLPAFPPPIARRDPRGNASRRAISGLLACASRWRCRGLDAGAGHGDRADGQKRRPGHGGSSSPPVPAIAGRQCRPHMRRIRGLYDAAILLECDSLERTRLRGSKNSSWSISTTTSPASSLRISTGSIVVRRVWARWCIRWRGCRRCHHAADGAMPLHDHPHRHGRILLRQRA